jgi:hypothetical protein
MKKAAKKLELSKETLRRLNDATLDKVIGGLPLPLTRAAARNPTAAAARSNEDPGNLHPSPLSRERGRG